MTQETSWKTALRETVKIIYPFQNVSRTNGAMPPDGDELVVQDQFWNELKELQEAINRSFHTTQFMSAQLTGEMYATLLKHYVERLNVGDTPDPVSAWKKIRTDLHETAVHEALYSYRAYMLEVCAQKKLPLDESDIRSRHEEATAVGVMVYKKRKLMVGGTAESNSMPASAFGTDIDMQLEDIQENFSASLKSFLAKNVEASNLTCTRLLESLFESKVMRSTNLPLDSLSHRLTGNEDWEHASSVTSSSRVDHSSISSTLTADKWSDFVTAYLRQARGPCAHSALATFASQRMIDLLRLRSQTDRGLEEGECDDGGTAASMSSVVAHHEMEMKALCNRYEDRIAEYEARERALQEELAEVQEKHRHEVIKSHDLCLALKDAEARNVELDAELRVSESRLEGLLFAKNSRERGSGLSSSPVSGEERVGAGGSNGGRAG